MNEGVMPTIGIDSLIQVCQLPDGSIIKVKIMDTAGQERYDSVSSSYYKKADCCLLVYDITNEDSFSAIENFYVKEIKDLCKENIKVILVGNKTDLKDERKISKKDGAELAQKYNFMFKETSCEYNSNVADVFETIITMTHTEKLKKGEYNNEIKTFKLGENDNDILITYEKKEKCCF